MNRPFTPRGSASSTPFTRVNGKIRAREVRLIDGENNQQLGIVALQEALSMARQRGVDLVEIAPNATPPVCKLIDFGKFRYEQAKKDKESKKHQHAGRVKEVQLSPTIDPHDFSVKLQHAIDFLSEEMKVKISLRFRGREMAHTEFGFQQVNRFIEAIGPWGHADNKPKLIGRGINVMISPLPRNKRARNPKEIEQAALSPDQPSAPAKPAEGGAHKKVVPTNAEEDPSQSGFSNNPFSKLNVR